MSKQLPLVPSREESTNESEFIFDPDRVGPWVYERTGGAYYPNSCSAIGYVRGGELIAGVVFEQYNGQSMLIHVAGEGKRWLTRRYIWLVFNYAFNQIKVKKLIGMVDSENAEALAFDRHLGFRQEACIKDAGKYGDQIIMTMTRQECRWI